MRRHRLCALTLFVSLNLLLGHLFAQAATPLPKVSTPNWIVQHWQQSSVNTLSSADADKPTHPASITKLLTAYVAMQVLSSGAAKLDDTLTISEQAVSQDGTRVGYRIGERVALQDALQGMLAISGNDAAWALAQHLGGISNRDSTDAVSGFIIRMNATSNQLGLKHSLWQNPHGLTEVGHVSTAADLAVLAHALWRDFPAVRPWLSVKTYSWHGVTQSNRNSLLWRDATVDGLKTGHTDAAGYNLAVSSNWRVAVDDDTYDWRLTSVVLGASSAADRAADSAALLAWGRNAFVPWRVYTTGTQLGRVSVQGAVGNHTVVTQAPVWLVLPADKPLNRLRYELHPDNAVLAPAIAGTQIAFLHIYDGQTLLLRSPLLATQAIAAAPWHHRVWAMVSHWVNAWLKSWFV